MKNPEFFSKNKIIILVSGLLLFNVTLNPASGQADSASGAPAKLWKFGGTFVVNINESSFTNWVAGGDNQTGLATILKPVLNFDNKKWSWASDIDLRYGVQKIQSEKPKKSDDSFRFTTKLGRSISKYWKFGGMYTLSTQLISTYDTDNEARLLSTFMAPGYTDLSLGFDYTPNAHLGVYLTPANIRSTYVLNDTLSGRGDFGVKPGKKVLVDFGPSAYLTFKDEVLKNVLVDTKLSVFQNIINKTGNPVVNWDAIITMKINKYLSTSFTFTLFYDPNSKIDIKDAQGNVTGSEARLQFKQTLGVGLNLNW
jgi:hypothetical protein